MELLQTTIVVGVTIGLVYALSGAGLVVIYRTSGYVSFAQGDIAAVALFFGLWLYRSGLPYPVVAVAVVVMGGLVGGLIGGLVVVPMERFGLISAALATVAVSILIQGVENVTVGAEQRPFPSAGDDVALHLGAVGVSRSVLVSAIVCVVVFALLGLAFSRTRTGVAMRAVNDNRTAAEIMGIPAARLRRLSWVLAGALAGIAGLFVAAAYGLSPTSVTVLLVYSFAAIVVGGFESIVGALVAGIVIGVGSTLAAAYLSQNLVNTVVLVVLVAVLLVRPHGLFGRRPLLRV
ncbi:branched-chain amino acid ABC transporter permease [Pseudonocardia sp. RS010]|uniref:branched-chain amino acid ABC transporter permease n=1 Tax=Pseudonocardia sp. RS010 TaxID=3385979 RepID=UPI00399FC394